MGCQPCDRFRNNDCPSGCKRKRYGISLSMWMYVKGTRVQDVSNVIKALEDALNGVAYCDDNQIVELHRCVKIYNAETERIVARLCEVDGIVDEEGAYIPIERTTAYKATEAVKLIDSQDSPVWLQMMYGIDKRKTIRRAIEAKLEALDNGKGTR